MAALMVFGLHLRNFGYFPGPVRIPATVMFAGGSSGVSFFFILSGFVLTWSARRTDTARRFWRRRIARIYPVHLVTALAALAMAVFLEPSTRPAGRPLAADLLLIHTWNPAWWQTLDTVSWSLSCEAFFYFAFPALHFLLQRLDHRATTAVAAAAAVIVVVLPVADHVLGLGWTLYSAPWARFPEFIIGAALARLVLLDRWRGPGLRGASALAAVGYFAAAVIPTNFAYACCTLVGFSLLIPAAAVADLHGLSSIWRGRGMVRLGQLSFAFYMVHILVLRAATHVFAIRQLTISQAAVAIAVVSVTSLGAAWMLYEVVERPAQRLLLGGTARRGASAGPFGRRAVPRERPSAARRGCGGIPRGETERKN